jgi:hypothetical protein
MSRKHEAHDDELEGVAQRLRDERPQASPLNLDRIKTTAMARVRANTRRGHAGARRLAIAGLTVGLLTAGTGGVLAAQSRDKAANAATAQYGSDCDTNNGNGNNIGSGNGSKDGNGNGSSKFAARTSWSGGKKGSSDSSSNNSSGNGNENGDGNGNENGNESGNGNNSFNCNENSFDETTINESNTTTNNVTNNYNAPTVTVTTPANNGVLATTTSKTATSKHPVKFHIDISKKTKLKKVTLEVNGKVLSVLKGKKASANISIADLPCSTTGTTVTVTAITSSDKKIVESHTYHLCT